MATDFSDPSAPPPDASPEARLQAAMEHMGQGRPEQALELARPLARTYPNHGAALAVWGVAAGELGRYAEAIGPLQSALKLAGDGATRASLASHLARSLSALGLWAEAERAVALAQAQKAGDPDTDGRLAGVLVRINLADRALPGARAAAAALPTRPDVQFNLAAALISTGELDEAQEALERVIALEPTLGKAHMGLADLKTWTADTAHVDRLEALRTSGRLDGADLAALEFALFKERDDLGQIDAAWAALERANQAARAAEPAWSAAADEAWTQAMIEAFPAERFAGPAQAPGEAGPRMIFIVGLPRSGTTLLERVLAAHSQVRAMGELPAFPLEFKRASKAKTAATLDADVARGAAGADWRGVRRAYLARTAYLAGNAAVAIDKLPGNEAYVGPIRLAFPDATIIHMRRGAMDSLFGAYKVMFHGAYRWSYRLADMADHYHRRQRLVDHWRACLGEGLVEIDYEALATDPETQIPALLAACGLEFEDACLRPHETAGAVATASSAQIRRPISTRSIGAWRRYADQLEPLRARLAEQGDL